MKIRGPRARAWLQRNYSFPLAARRSFESTVEITNGASMELDGSDIIARTILVTGTWEPNVSPVVTGLLARGDTFVDVGANIGFYTMLAAPIVGPEGRVVSIEPASAAYSSLTRNLALNGFTGVEALRLAVSDAAGQAPLYLSPDQGNPASTTLSTEPLSRRSDGRPLETADDCETEMVEVRTLAEVLADVPTDRPIVCKIDVEGLERQALDGLAPLVANGFDELAIAIELTPAWSGDGTVGWFSDFVAAHGLDLYEMPNGYDVGSLVVQRFTPPTRIDEVPSVRCDLLAVRGPLLTERVAALGRH